MKSPCMSSPPSGLKNHFNPPTPAQSNDLPAVWRPNRPCLARSWFAGRFRLRGYPDDDGERIRGHRSGCHAPGARDPDLHLPLRVVARIEVEADGQLRPFADFGRGRAREELAQFRRTVPVSGPLANLHQAIERAPVAERGGLRVELRGGLLVLRDTFALFVALAKREVHVRKFREGF